MSRPTILYAWERGRGFGHVAAFADLAQGLLDRGVCVSAAVRHRAHARAVLDQRVELLRAPRVKTPTARRQDAVTYADVLAPNGFGDAASLRRLVDQWLRILRDIEPDLVVCDAAPGALLALRFAPCPAVMLGNGFTVPPCVDPMPWLRPWLSPWPEDELRRRERPVVACINEVLTQDGHQRLQSLGELFATASPRLCTVPELDHYRRPNAPAYLGPLTAGAWGIEPTWGVGRPRVFAYLHDGPHLRGTLCAMSNAPGQYSVYCPDAPDDVEVPSGVRLVDQPARLDALLDHADAFIGNGGHGMTAAFVCAGKPVLVLPHTLEQAIMGYRVMQAGVGLAPERADVDYGALLQRLVDDASLAARADEIGVGWRDPMSRLDALVDDLAGLANRES